LYRIWGKSAKERKKHFSTRKSACILISPIFSYFPMASPYDDKALALHKAHQGKLETVTKTPIHTLEDLSTVYTPGVGAVSVEIGKDREKVYDYTMKGRTIAVVSNGTAILGLGDLGPEAALPVMEGKAVLFKEMAGVDAVPLCIDAKTPEEVIAFVQMVAPTFGGINLEDIKAPECFFIEEQLRKTLDIPVMHDDQHGTAVVVLAGLLNATKCAGKEVKTAKIVINGAGAAGTSVAQLLLRYGCAEIIVCDSQGILVPGRASMNDEKEALAKITNPTKQSGTVRDALIQADIFIGVSGPNLLMREDIKTMAPKAIVFALANPTPEILPEEAKAGGAYIVATGRSDFPNQVNNALAFPGIFRGMLEKRIPQFTEEHFLRAAFALAEATGEIHEEHILPSVLDKTISGKIASAL
jgi:malate dehydrogenase (oxaloacetate-decarboxylating)